MSIPEGFKLVPVEPTDEMRDVIRGGGYSRHLYSNLLAAAPSSAQPIYDEAKERELFEAWYSNDIGVALSVVQDWRKGDGYAASYERCCLSWYAWKACAQSRAKSVEVDHE